MDCDWEPVKVTGTVSKVEWLNPHVWFYVDVKDDTGKITTWGFSGGPPGMLQRSGITKDALKVGDVITVDGFRAKDNLNQRLRRQRDVCGWPQGFHGVRGRNRGDGQRQAG